MFMVKLFLKTCSTCGVRRPLKPPPAGKPIISLGFLTRVQVDLIDMSSRPDGQFRWIMHLRDHFTKFSWASPLTSKRAIEVAEQLTNIFCMFGPPKILQSDNGREFTAEVINELTTKWKGLIIIHGRPRHPQSQGCVERGNGDLQMKLGKWMHENGESWSTGLMFVIHSINTSTAVATGKTPYELVFGQSPRASYASMEMLAEEGMLEEETIPGDILEKEGASDIVQSVSGTDEQSVALNCLGMDGTSTDPADSFDDQSETAGVVRPITLTDEISTVLDQPTVSGPSTVPDEQAEDNLSTASDEVDGQSSASPNQHATNHQCTPLIDQSTLRKQQREQCLLHKGNTVARGRPVVNQKLLHGHRVSTDTHAVVEITEVIDNEFIPQELNPFEEPLAVGQYVMWSKCDMMSADLDEVPHKKIRLEAQHRYLKTAARQQQRYEQSVKVKKVFSEGDTVGIKISHVDRTNTDSRLLPCKIKECKNKGQKKFTVSTQLLES